MTKFGFCVLFFLLLASCVVSTSMDVDDDGYQNVDTLDYVIEHNLGDYGEFVTRGRVVIGIRGERAQAQVQPFVFGEVDAERFTELASSGGRYRIRIAPRGDLDLPTVSTSIDACALLQAGTKEELLLHVTSQGLLSVSYTAPQDKKVECIDLHVPIEHALKTRVKVTLPKDATSPLREVMRGNPDLVDAPTEDGTYAPTDAAASDPDAPKEKSFFQKYWHYILIALLFTLFTPAPPEQGGAGGAGGAGGGRAPAGGGGGKR